MGKQSRRKRDREGSTSDAEARRFIEDLEREGRRLSSPESLARADRRAEEIREKEGHHRLDPPGTSPMSDQLCRVNFLYDSAEASDDCFRAAVAAGQSRPVGMICGLQEAAGLEIALACPNADRDQIRAMREEALANPKIYPVAVVAMPRAKAVQALRKTSPRTAAFLEEPEPHGVFPVVVVALKGSRAAYQRFPTR